MSHTGHGVGRQSQRIARAKATLVIDVESEVRRDIHAQAVVAAERLDDDLTVGSQRGCRHTDGFVAVGEHRPGNGRVELLVHIGDDKIQAATADRQLIVPSRKVEIFDDQIVADDAGLQCVVLHGQRDIIAVAAGGVVDDESRTADRERAAVSDRTAADQERPGHGVGAVVVDDHERVAIGGRVAAAERENQIRATQSDGSAHVQLIVAADCSCTGRAIDFDVEIRATDQRQIAGVDDAGAVAWSNSAAALRCHRTGRACATERGSVGHRDGTYDRVCHLQRPARDRRPAVVGIRAVQRELTGPLFVKRACATDVGRDARRRGTGIPGQRVGLKVDRPRDADRCPSGDGTGVCRVQRDAGTEHHGVRQRQCSPRRGHAPVEIDVLPCPRRNHDRIGVGV